MIQHPIPQNVTAYEFHLIGNMTIKQFIEMAVGVGAAVFFYSTALPDFIKWPLILVSVALGGAMAFLPFDGRPLDRMIIIFFRAVYSPTQYIWRKSAQIPDYFTFTPRKDVKADPNQEERVRLRKNLDEYLQTLPQSPLEQQRAENNQVEEQYVSSIKTMFDQTPITQPVQAVEDTSFKPQTKVTAHKIKPQEQVKTEVHQSQPVENINIPTNEPVQVQPETTPEVKSNEQMSEVTPQPVADTTNTPQVQVVPENAQAATTNKSLPFPSKPKEANVLVGMILTPDNKIIDNAVIQIRDQNNHTTRALKSNSLGQFFSASPLRNGKYYLHTEKTGYNFDDYQLELDNTVLEPIIIQAKNE